MPLPRVPRGLRASKRSSLFSEHTQNIKFLAQIAGIFLPTLLFDNQPCKYAVLTHTSHDVASSLHGRLINDPFIHPGTPQSSLNEVLVAL
eukprot:1158542-Pelagomonas_calceolata.AAC.8